MDPGRDFAGRRLCYSCPMPQFRHRTQVLQIPQSIYLWHAPDALSGKPIYTHMIQHRTLLSTLLLLLHTLLMAQQPLSLPRSTPEAEGISSEGILQFLEASEKSDFEIHSLMVLRHGKVVAEAWAKPYGPDLVHTMYSCSKSFTATAVGLAVSEKRLTVNDKVISFFPNDVPAEISPNLAALRVKDLLTMSTGHDPDPTGNIRTDTNWVRAFLSTPIVHKPGTVFLYNSLATYVLSAIVQKVTGEKVIDYLKPRLFTPLGINGVDWEEDPTGVNVGGWGLRLKTEDMAKFGQLFLQKGQWNGQQILPAAWVEEATTLKIVQHPEMPKAKRDSSDWEQGYCYQMWRSRHNSYRGDGAYGQYILVLPDKDAVIAVTSETANMQETFNYIWKYIYPAIRKDAKLPANKKTLQRLQQKCAAFALPLPAKTPPTTIEKSVTGKTIRFSENELSTRQMSLTFKGDQCRASIEFNGKTYAFDFGAGQWVFGETTKTPPALTQLVKGYFVGLPPSKTAAAYRWRDPQTLELTLRYLESPHSELFLLRFNGSNVDLEYTRSNDRAKKIIAKGLVITP